MVIDVLPSFTLHDITIPLIIFSFLYWLSFGDKNLNMRQNDKLNSKNILKSKKDNNNNSIYMNQNY